MDSFSTQKPKSRKMKKRLAKKSRVEIILDLFFRAIEIVVVLVTLAKLSYELVVTFEDSSVASVILANRSLAFVIGNAIVIALIAKSGILLNQEHDPKCKSNDLYEDFVLESSRRVEHKDITMTIEKQNLTEKRQIQSYQRSKSENLKVLEKSSCGRLKRSETDASAERFDSDDELRYKIESFIARQRRNQTDE
ncbi:unnamed protein product [Arabidopsis thaliana]|uniref:(thale cress) hypothetical protein n=1 Tax=Arabidopsis thaliana TaxID=3702 RepID=A0A7G2F408_ARATH|nr:unnamed protein product [Arabidopsis thaliana]